MYLKLDDKRTVNTDYIITLGVGQLKEQDGHRVLAQLINGQMMSLYLFDSKVAAEAKLDLLIKDHNLNHMKVHNDVKLLSS